jgi:hypothetical protein
MKQKDLRTLKDCTHARMQAASPNSPKTLTTQQATSFMLNKKKKKKTGVEYKQIEITKNTENEETIYKPSMSFSSACAAERQMCYREKVKKKK